MTTLRAVAAPDDPSDDDGADTSWVSLASPPAAPVARRRVRTVPVDPEAVASLTAALEAPGAQGEPSDDAPEGDDTADPRIARLRTVLDMTAAGKSQGEIAHALGCTDRTVRNLLQEARRKQVRTFRARSADAVVADLEHKNAAQYSRWMSVLEKAKHSGDIRTEAFVLAKVDQHLFNRTSILGRVGYFDNVQFKPPLEGVQRSIDATRRQFQLEQALLGPLLFGGDIDATAEHLMEELDLEDEEGSDPLYG